MIQLGTRCKSMVSSDPMNFLISKAINMECWFQDRVILRVLVKNSSYITTLWNFTVEQQRAFVIYSIDFVYQFIGVAEDGVSTETTKLVMSLVLVEISET